MTLYYPDVSNHQGTMTLQAGTVAVCAKISEGATYADPTFLHYEQEAARVGAVLFGYHFLRAGAGAAQAAWCFKLVGAHTNVMIDCEPVKNAAAGYISKPTVQDVLDFAAKYRSLGGLCTLVYLPRWYWEVLGSPSLAPLIAAGLSVVSSNYTTYSDTGPGWTPYAAGMPAPAVWQYTETQSYAGQRVDFNAYRGTVGQFKALLGYVKPTQQPAATQPSSHILEEDENMIRPVAQHPDGYAWVPPMNSTQFIMVADGDNGAPASIRLVIWKGNAPVVQIVKVGGSAEHREPVPIPAGTTGVTATRQDAGGFTVGVAFA